jgi:hypothetical protein
MPSASGIMNITSGGGNTNFASENEKGGAIRQANRSQRSQPVKTNHL